MIWGETNYSFGWAENTQFFPFKIKEALAFQKCIIHINTYSWMEYKYQGMPLLSLRMQFQSNKDYSHFVIQ